MEPVESPLEPDLLDGHLCIYVKRLGMELHVDIQNISETPDEGLADKLAEIVHLSITASLETIALETAAEEGTPH